MSRSIVLALEVAAEPSAVIEAIVTTQGLASFWTPTVSGSTDVGHRHLEILWCLGEPKTQRSTHVG